MAATGTAVYPSTSLFPGSSVYPGQGSKPLALVLMTTDDASVANPSWTALDEDQVRAWSTSRGRENELADVDTGTATITLDNRDRTFDPAHNSAIRPLNRWWIREQFAGVTNDVFKGYAESYQQVWPDKKGVDAVAVVSCVDEMARLARKKLPATDPPRDSYQDVAMFYGATGYYPMLAPNVHSPSGEGRTLEVGGSAYAYSTGDGAIVGQDDPGYAITTSNWYLQNDIETPGEPWDAGGLAEFAFSFWFRAATSLPASQEILVAGPWTNASSWSYRLHLNTTGTFTLEVKNSGGTNHSINSTTAVALNQWYHVVGTLESTDVILYVNGVEENSTAWTGAIDTVDPTGTPMFIGNGGVDIGSAQRNFDELSFYRTALDADAVMAHYTAGAHRGFPRSQEPGDRVNSVLNAISSTAPRSIRTGTRNMTGSYMVAQDPLSELRKAENAESVDALLFVAKDGTITFLDDGHRSVSPWNTVQATFDDDGTDLPYFDISLDYSNSFLANVWHVTPAGFTTSTVSDAASVAAYDEWPQSLNDLPITGTGTAIATAMLAKYKDPMTRVTELTLLCVDDDLIDQVFRLIDIGSRIRVFRTPPGGGSRIDQTLFVQKIQVDATPYRPWQVRLSVSPL